ncbi:hypothetical protein PT974_07056 [Cladobotryum mycophilum]|uniref:Uncharacterized protein n=1 Tax=Cladobotryum mycophilum TaxID=491253 RepID=A0ABR0SN95_9HYPO
MPCYFSLLEYSKCDNKNLRRLGCTDRCGSDGTCPIADREILVGFKYEGLCQECHSSRTLLDSSKEVLELKKAFRYMNIDDKEPGEKSAKREGLEEKVQRLEREKTVIQVAEDWAENYAANLWMVMYDYEGDEGLRQDGLELLKQLKRDMWPGVSITMNGCRPGTQTTKVPRKLFEPKPTKREGGELAVEPTTMDGVKDRERAKPIPSLRNIGSPNISWPTAPSDISRDVADLGFTDTRGLDFGFTPMVPVRDVPRWNYPDHRGRRNMESTGNARYGLGLERRTFPVRHVPAGDTGGGGEGSSPQQQEQQQQQQEEDKSNSNNSTGNNNGGNNSTSDNEATDPCLAFLGTEAKQWDRERIRW